MNENIDFTNLDDNEIVEMANAGNMYACDFLLRKYSYIVKSYTRAFFIIGAESDDLVQEGMLGLYKAIRTYKKGNKAKFKTYSNMCIRNSIFDAIKSANRKKHTPLNNYISFNQPVNSEEDTILLDIFSNGIISAETEALENESYENLKIAIKNLLTDRENQILKLYLKGLTYQQIAESLDTNSKNIDNNIQKIKRKLKKELAL